MNFPKCLRTTLTQVPLDFVGSAYEEQGPIVVRKWTRRSTLPPRVSHSRETREELGGSSPGGVVTPKNPESLQPGEILDSRLAPEDRVQIVFWTTQRAFCAVLWEITADPKDMGSAGNDVGSGQTVGKYLLSA